jgi:Na+/melibiose symporter-like transporter
MVKEVITWINRLKAIFLMIFFTDVFGIKANIVGIMSADCFT